MELEPLSQTNIQQIAKDTAKYSYAESDETQALKVAQKALQYKLFNKALHMSLKVFKR